MSLSAYNSPRISANGIKGHLLRGPSTGRYVFRVYNQDKTFIDYDLLHYDLEVTITDADAYLYNGDGLTFLDHSLETLGLKA